MTSVAATENAMGLPEAGLGVMAPVSADFWLCPDILLAGTVELTDSRKDAVAYLQTLMLGAVR